MEDQYQEQNPMPEQVPESVKEALLNDPAQTKPPTQIILEAEPIPNPDLPNKSE